MSVPAPDVRRLPPETFRELAGMCEALGIPLRTWGRVSWLRVYIEARAVAEVLETVGCTRDQAADLVGVEAGTSDQRFTRATRHAYDPSRGGLVQTDKLSVPAPVGFPDREEHDAA